MTYIVIIILVIVLFFLGKNFVTKVPHGRVGWQTGLFLKVLKPYKGEDIFEIRELFENIGRGRKFNKSLPVKTVKEFEVPTSTKPINCRLYHPEKGTNQPLIVFTHGGGFCAGSLNTHDEVCRRLAIKSGFPLLSIEYSLSPEVHYPVPLNEITDVILWTESQSEFLKADTSKIIIVGDSAGGNFVITSTLKLLQLNKASRIKCLVPVYPSVNYYEEKDPSFTEYDKGYFLEKEFMDAFTENCLLGDEDYDDPLFNPMAAKIIPEFPPSFFINAEFDPIRDEGERFAKRLKEQGHIVEQKRYLGTIHGFFGVGGLGPTSKEAVDDAVDFIKRTVLKE